MGAEEAMKEMRGALWVDTSEDYAIWRAKLPFPDYATSPHQKQTNNQTNKQWKFRLRSQSSVAVTFSQSLTLFHSLITTSSSLSHHLLISLLTY